MQTKVTVTMTREQAAEIYERLQEEVGLDTVKASMDLEPNAILTKIAYAKQLAELFEPVMDSLRNDTEEALKQQRANLRAAGVVVLPRRQ